MSHATVIHVTDFGAVPDNGHNDVPGIRAALAAARAQSATSVVFAPGRYDLHTHTLPQPNPHFQMQGMDGLVLEGNGAQLLFHGMATGFHFADCKNLTLRNLTLDSARPPFSLGEIRSASGNHFDVRVFDDYPVQGVEPVQALLEYDPATGRIHPDSIDIYYGVERTELLEPQVLRVYLRHPHPVKVGQWMLLRHHIYGYNGFTMYDCENVLLEHVTIHAIPGMGLYANNCHDITVANWNVVPRPGSGHPMSTTADATHFHRCTGTVTIRDSTFEGMGDDAGNVKGLYLTAEDLVGDREIVGKHNLGIPTLPKAGDTLEFVNRATLVTYATGVVAAATADMGDGRHGVRFVDALPEAFTLGDVLGNATRSPRTRISNCVVRNNRARGFLIQTRDAVVEDCHFEYVTAGGVYVMTEVVHFFESLGARNVTVRNNTFIQCGYARPAGSESPVTVYGLLENFALPPVPGVHRDITIEGNLIEGCRNSGIFVAGTDGFRIQGNTLRGVCANPTRPQGTAAIHVMSSANGSIVGNEIDPQDQGNAFRDVVTIGPGCDEASISIGSDGMMEAR